MLCSFGRWNFVWSGVRSSRKTLLPENISARKSLHRVCVCIRYVMYRQRLRFSTWPSRLIATVSCLVKTLWAVSMIKRQVWSRSTYMSTSVPLCCQILEAPLSRPLPARLRAYHHQPPIPPHLPTATATKTTPPTATSNASPRVSRLIILISLQIFFSTDLVIY